MIPYDCMIYFSKKQYDKCLEILEKEKNKDNIKDNINEILYKKSEIYYELAKIESDTKRLNKAIGLLKTLIKKDNNKTYNEYAFLASIYNEKIKLLEPKKYEKKIKSYYRKVIEYYNKAINLSIKLIIFSMIKGMNILFTKQMHRII